MGEVSGHVRLRQFLSLAFEMFRPGLGSRHPSSDEDEDEDEDDPPARIYSNALGRFSVSNNKLLGEIPSSLGNCLGLEYLCLDGNLFQGSIPPTFANLKGLRLLDLSHNNLSGKIPRYLEKFALDSSLKMSYADLFKATDGFSPTNLIGTGTSGSVYKGFLHCNETIVAVKVFNLQRQGAMRSFMAECEELRNMRQQNLVNILTCCSSIDFKGNDFKALVYEYMSNGSLDMWLHEDGSEQGINRNLKLIQRLDVAINVALFLDYLYNHASIIHRDLKPSNILLDDDMITRMGDFGIARCLDEIAQTMTVVIMGSARYIAPGNNFIYFLS
ncbi:probable LRR receptor-like serine/threonine-protein kinase At3g47570 [Magnolia sinica]|uniref:probable LRR receptor-like serine/threonine-protein kinase At3g47570 n=1 Tax=Magnolia sinica TaxID=86752 RepID=UPI00265A7F71|nr:probable LRR receptor-like serine/threonine-protein kinase At3g47570 [Magnolia sinica]